MDRATNFGIYLKKEKNQLGGVPKKSIWQNFYSIGGGGVMSFLIWLEGPA